MALRQRNICKAGYAMGSQHARAAIACLLCQRGHSLSPCPPAWAGLGRARDPHPATHVVLVPLAEEEMFSVIYIAFVIDLYRTGACRNRDTDMAGGGARKGVFHLD